MSSDIFYDRLIGPTSHVDVSDEVTTTLSVGGETAPTEVSARNYGTVVIQVSGPGDTPPALPATCSDTLGGSYTLVKEVLFNGFALDVFSHVEKTPYGTTTVTTSHQPAKRRIIMASEWYNLNNVVEKHASAFSATSNAAVELGDFHIGRRHWLVIAALAIGGASHGDSVSIPDDWNLLLDSATNVGDSHDIRLIVAYQIANKHKKVDFHPTIGNPYCWGGVMFAYKAKI
jgi:hypothetical protein